MTPFVLADVALYLGFPVVAQRLAARYGWARALGPATLCYCAGILYANQPLHAPYGPVAEAFGYGAAALAIPLLLFSLDVGAWTRMAGKALLAFGVVFVAVVTASVTTHLVLAGSVEGQGTLAGMLAAVYLGVTANMAAVQVARGAPSELFVNANAADLLVSAIYLLVVFSVGPKLLGLITPAYPRSGANVDATASDVLTRRPTLGQRALALGVAVAICVVGGSTWKLAPASFAMATAILSITSLAVLASLVPKVRSLPGTYGMGQLLLLVFCTATGSLADFGRLFSTSLPILAFTCALIGLVLVLEVVLGALLRIDRDTLLITSVATIMSPAFVAPVADKLENREVVITGIASGLMGCAVANYVGILLAWWLG